VNGWLDISLTMEALFGSESLMERHKTSSSLLCHVYAIIDKSDISGLNPIVQDKQVP